MGKYSAQVRGSSRRDRGENDAREIPTQREIHFLQTAGQSRCDKLPACALVGHLGAAREHFKKKNLRPAWEATLAAIQSRPFHPEGHLLLAEIAQAAGDSITTRNCAQQAVRLAPEWKPAKQFLKGNL